MLIYTPFHSLYAYKFGRFAPTLENRCDFVTIFLPDAVASSFV